MVEMLIKIREWHEMGIEEKTKKIEMSIEEKS